MTYAESTAETLIDIGHTQVAHYQIGTGPDVLFVHGWPLDHRTWQPVVNALAGVTAHLVDLPGSGRSMATPTTPLTMADQAESLAAVLDHLDLDSVTLIGHDSGGMIARMVAAEKPERVAALVLSGTEIPGHHPWQVAMFSLLAKLPGSKGVLKTMLNNDVLARSPLALGGCYHDMANASESFAMIMGDLLSDDEVMESQMTLIRNLDNETVQGLTDVHRRLAMPALLIWGEDDPFFPIEKAKAMVAQFAGPTRFETVPKAKLFVHDERPEHYAGLVAGFLAEHTT